MSSFGSPIDEHDDFWGGSSSDEGVRSRKDKSKMLALDQYSKRRPIPHSATRSTRPFFSVPYDRNAYFVTPDRVFGQLERKCAARESRTALVGARGIGKTQLAIEYAYQVGERSPQTWVLWVHANSALRLYQSFSYIADFAKIEGRQDRNVSVFSLVYDWLHSCEEPWLLILDDFDDADGVAGSLRTGLIGNHKGSILVTTRSWKIASRLLKPNDNIFVGPMDRAGAQTLFRQSFGKWMFTHITGALSTSLGYSPLVVVLAAAYVRTHNISITEYWSLIENQDEKVVRLLAQGLIENDTEDVKRDYPEEFLIAKVWLISFEMIRQRCPLAVEYMSLMACLEPRAMPEKLFRAPLGFVSSKPFRTLEDHSFISVSVQRIRSLVVHQAAHLVMRSWLKKEGTLEQWTETAIRRLNQVLRPDKDEHRSFSGQPAVPSDTWKDYVPHAMHLLRVKLVNEDNENTSTPPQRRRAYVVPAKWTDEARHLLEKALRIYKEMLELADMDAIWVVSQIATTFEDLGATKAVVEVQEYALLRAKQFLGEDHSDTITIMLRLASALRSGGRLEEALRMQEEGLAKRKRILGEDHPDTISAMGNLTRMLLGAGKLKDAVKVQDVMIRKPEHSSDESISNTIAAMCDFVETPANLDHPDVPTSSASTKPLNGQDPTSSAYLEYQSPGNGAVNLVDNSKNVRVHGLSRIHSLLNSLKKAGRSLARPRLRPGHKRLEWKCTCGELLYGDFKETAPGSIEQLVTRLNEHSGQTSESEPHHISQSPSKSQTRRTTSQVGWSLPTEGVHSNSSTTSTRSPATPVTPTISSPAQHQALQLCFETGKFTLELNELDFGQTHSDGKLFEKIREKYESTRRSRFPMRLRFSKPEKVIFIKFRLGSRPLVSLISGSIDKPSIPPESEVQAGNYQYTPCPIEEPPIDSRIFFHHFYAPESNHPDSMWSERLPWRIGPPLTPMAHGWGIHLEERPDWPLFAAFTCVIMLVSGLVAGVYAWKTGDNQTGVAIGAWLTTVQTMGMTALFFWWTYAH